MKKYLIPLALSIVFFIAGIVTLSDYGMNWDAPLRWARGQAYLHYFLTGELKYNYPQRLSPVLLKPNEFMSRFDFLEGEFGELPKLPERPLPQAEVLDKRISFYQHESWNGNYWMNLDGGHTPFPDILSSISNRIFWGKLGLLGDIGSYQLIYIFVSAMGVFIVSLFTFEITRSNFAAIIAGLVLSLNPIFFSESHFNMKDPLQASMFAAAIWTFWNWVKSNSSKWMISFTLFIALALVFKWNIIFLPFIIIPWLFFIRNSDEFKAWFIKKNLSLLLLASLIALTFTILVQPYFWNKPFEGIMSLINFYWEVGTRIDPIQPEGFILPGRFNLYPAFIILSQTPEIILALVGFGLIGAIRRGNDLKVGYLLLLWSLIPILRFSLPHTWFYNGSRQMMEVLPALAVLSGLGTVWLSKRLGLLGRLGIFGLTVFLLTTPILRFHPNENTYFNSIAGGLEGVAEKGLIDNKITYGNIYRQGVEWLNEHAEKDANLAFLDGPMFALSPLFLRKDISISPFHFSGFDKKGEYILTLFNKIPPAVFAARYPQVFLNPIHQITADNVALLTIYKNEPKYLKSDSKKSEGVIEDFTIKPVQNKDDFYLEIDLGKEVRVTRIILSAVPGYCPSTHTQFIDEFINFIPQQEIESRLHVKNAYGLQERKGVENGIEYYFPAEPARLIRIYPQDRLSCFINGKIKTIFFL